VTPRLVVITDLSREHCLERIERLLRRARTGSVLVQLRDHELSIRRRLEIGRVLRRTTAENGQHLAVNDRIDLALALGVDALHLGESSIETGQARRIFPGWISRASHRIENTDADAVLLSPIVEARHGRDALGIAALGRARECLDAERRLFALGGVSATTARACLDAGADGVAVMSAALDTDDASPLLEALGIVR
jgi:thiamine-phosphate pyrophosphorylase